MVLIARAPHQTTFICFLHDKGDEITEEAKILKAIEWIWKRSQDSYFSHQEVTKPHSAKFDKIWFTTKEFPKMYTMLLSVYKIKAR